jgi:hypothetical protein
MEVKPKLSWTWDCPKCRTPYVLWKSAPSTLTGFSHSCPLCGAAWEVKLPDEAYTTLPAEGKNLLPDTSDGGEQF